MARKAKKPFPGEPYVLARSISEALVDEGSKAPYQFGKDIIISRVISSTTGINQPVVIAVLRAFVSAARHALDQGSEVVLPNFLRFSVAHDCQGRRFLTVKVLPETARWLGLEHGARQLS